MKRERINSLEGNAHVYIREEMYKKLKYTENLQAFKAGSGMTITMWTILTATPK